LESCPAGRSARVGVVPERVAGRVTERRRECPHCTIRQPASANRRAGWGFGSIP